MRTRRLGSGVLEVSALGLGCMNMSEFYGATDDEESLATIRYAIELGITFFDTADLYGSGHNERLLGRALAGQRNEVIIATKFGFVRDASRKVVDICGRREYVLQACDESLKRLGTDHIDLYYQHRVDANTPIEETVGAMSELVTAGKVRFIGLSEAGEQTIRRANAVHPITALQTEYALWSRDIEERILPTCRELGISLVAYSPLGRGFLAGSVRSASDLGEDDFRRSIPRFQTTNFQRNLKVLAAVKALARQRAVTPAQVALAWVLAQGDDVVPIPGCRRRSHLEDNARSLDVELFAEELHELEEAARYVAGERYGEAGLRRVGL